MALVEEGVRRGREYDVTMVLEQEKLLAMQEEVVLAVVRQEVVPVV